MESGRNEVLDFNLPKQSPTIIKVIGVGGGGGNAVNHMYGEGIHDVSFVVCNTDAQALNSSPVPTHLQLGKEGLGAGNRPEIACQAAEDSKDEIRAMLEDGTKMVFITAGMGGGTGTGAAPVIAREAMSMGILTVGIVTIPFRFEGNKKIDQALDGLDKMRKQVDALLVINNERLREIYNDKAVLTAFAQADDTLSIAAKSIAEIVTVRGETMNLDFRDVSNTLKGGGVAIMSTAYAEGEGRVSHAIKSALDSPLLNHSDVFKSSKIIVNIVCCKEEGPLMMEEMNEIHEFMSKFGDSVQTKFGLGSDSSLGKKVKITILATGFGLSDVLTDVQGAERFANPVDEEDEERKRKRRESFYGTESGKTQERHYCIFHFTPSYLDDDEVISMVETSPTYKRDRDSLKEIKKRAEQLCKRDCKMTTSESNEADAKVIVF